MEAQTQHWIDRVDRVTQEIREACQSLSQEILNFKPDPNTWSVAQVIEHLLAVNNSYRPVFDQLEAGRYHAPWTARIPYFPKMLGRMILNSVKPSTTRRTRTFPMWEPSQSAVQADIVDLFVAQQGALAETIRALESDVEKGTIISSPANVNIVYSLRDAFEIIVTHEERHLGQLKRVLGEVQKG